MSKQNQIAVTPQSALLAHLIDTLAQHGYNGTMRIDISLGAIFAVRLYHPDKAGKIAYLDVPVEDLDKLCVSQGGTPSIQ
jgi:hypothetical protein